MAISDPAESTFIIPDVLKDWPFKRRDNPAFGEVLAEHRKWFQGLKTNPRYQKTFEGCNAALLCAIAYPDAPAKHVRIGADLLLLEFVIDDVADHLTTTEATAYANIIKDVLE